MTRERVDTFIILPLAAELEQDRINKRARRQRRGRA